MFGYLYQLFLVWDALRMKNTIQVIGLVVYNLGILVYAGIQYDQIKDAADALHNRAFLPADFWSSVQPMLIAVPAVMAVATAVFSFVAWKLYDEFAWTIYKHISADLRLKRRYLTYQVRPSLPLLTTRAPANSPQIYIALLKFDFFFFLAFTVQFLVVVKNTTNIELGLTGAALVVTFFLLFAAAFWVRRESVAGMVAIIVVYFIALAYFLFKLIRMYVAGVRRQEEYKPARKSLTVFAVLTILLLLLTIVIACMCTHNFNKGLKPHVNKKTVSSDKAYGTEMPSVEGPQRTQRMEID
jgi:NADH:ubiquinone oxidoreductase subunit 6 (subunit J)